MGKEWRGGGGGGGGGAVDCPARHKQMNQFCWKFRPHAQITVGSSTT